MTFLQRPGGDESYGVADLRRCLSLGSSALVVLPHMLQRTYVKKGRARRAVGHVCVAQYNVVVVLLAILCTSSSSIIVVANGSRVPRSRRPKLKLKREFYSDFVPVAQPGTAAAPIMIARRTYDPDRKA